jgi:hypothetical protein
VARAAIQLGTRLADVVEVTGGLESGQQVVSAGHQKLYDGARVMPMAAGGPGAAPDGGPGSGAGGSGK